MVNKTVGKELLLLLKLVSFFKKIRHQHEEKQLEFFLVNELYEIIPYKQCIIWSYNNGKVILRNASGQIDVSQSSPYAQFIIRHIQNTINKEGLKDKDRLDRLFQEESYSKTYKYSLSDYKDYDPNDIKEWASPHSLCLFLRDNQSLIGGIWFERNSEFGSIEMAMLDDIGDAFSERVQTLTQKKASFLKRGGLKGNLKKVILILLGLLCLIPVRHSSSVTVEVVSEDVRAISVPYNGLIKDVHVSPNQRVIEGDLLFSLDKTGLQNEYNIARQELETARQKLEKTERESFGDTTKKSDLKILREQIKRKQVELDYAREKLNFSQVKATEDGIVLFGDRNDLLGQPIQAGQQVMMLADPSQIELLLQIPSENMININREVPVRFFLNIAPLKSHKAMLKTISYKPQKNTNGVFGYSARADIKNVKDIGRIGLTGSGKVYGDRTILIFNILRRPFVSLRNLLDI